MKTLKILSSIFVMLSFALSTGNAHATAYVIDLSLNATPNSDAIGSNPSAGMSLHIRGWNLAGLFTPFNVVSGDTIQANISFNGPVLIVDNNPSFALGDLQSSSISFGDGINGSPFTFSVSTAATFTGTTGDFVGDPAVNSVTGTTFVEGVGAGIGAANLTDSTMTFTGVSFLIDVISIPPQSEPLDIGSFNIGDELNPVPAPGALALLIPGLIGIGGLRRKTKPAA